MLMSVEEFKTYVDTDMADVALEARLRALELLIRAHTHNNFQKRGYQARASITGAALEASAPLPFKIGDTIQITESLWDEGLFTVNSVSGATCAVKEELTDEPEVLCIRVEYPMDVKMGAVNMLKWDLENRDKVGVQSETISRHSVTYFNMDGENSSLGYPKSLTGFLKPYMRARF